MAEERKGAGSGVAVKITNGKELGAWLKDKPREVAVAIAARAALRVAPLAVLEIRRDDDAKAQRRFRNLMATIFRATAIGRVAAVYPTRPIDRAAAVDVVAAFDVVAAYYAAAAARAAAAAAADDDATFYTAYAAAAASTAATAADVAAAAAHDFWDAVAADATSIVMMEPSLNAAIAIRASELAREASLWFAAPPAWIPGLWNVLRVALSVDDWQVWIDWYERRLKGVADSEEIELIYASVPESEWKKGPAAANAWIRARLEEAGWDNYGDHNESQIDPATIEKFLTQDSHGATVEVVNGRARLAPSGSAEDAAAAQDRQTIQQHERARARAMAARDRVLRLANQHGFENIAVTVDELSRYLAEDTQSVAGNISTVWELSTAIGTFIERDNEVRAGRGGMTPQMDADAREALDQLVVTLAPFVRRFPTARQNDEDVRIFRQTRETIEAPKRIFEQAAAENLVEAQSNRIIIVATSAAERGEGIQAEKSRSWLGATARNFIIALIVATGTTAGALTMKYGEKAVEDFYEHSQSREIIQKFLREKESDVIALFKDLPADLKGALLEIYRRLREGKTIPPTHDPTQRA